MIYECMLCNRSKKLIEMDSILEIKALNKSITIPLKGFICKDCYEYYNFKNGKIKNSKTERKSV